MKIMLFSDIPPCTNYSAGIVLNKMCGFLLAQGHSVCCYTVLNADLNPRIPGDKKRRMAFKTTVKPRENFGGGISSLVHNSWNAYNLLPRIGRDAAGFARENECNLIWVAEQGQSIIKAVRWIAQYSNLPYVIQTWDSPEWWMRANKYDAVTRHSTMRAYGNALAQAECFIAASWVMEREFGEKYHCKRSKAVVLGFPQGRVTPLEKHDDSAFIIGMCGQVYAQEEFVALLRALNAMGWHRDGRKIVLELYLADLPELHLDFDLPKENVHLNGWISQEDLLPRLANYDLLYCPYWFHRDFWKVSHTSFPSKLSTYLKTGTAVAIHGPDYASPVIFAKENHCAYHLDTLDAEKLKDELGSIIEDNAGRRAMGEYGYTAFENKLTDQCMLKDFFDALGLTVNDALIERPQPRLRILHVNHTDLAGARFNGYDMADYCSDENLAIMRQVVLRKESNNTNVLELLKTPGLRAASALCSAYEAENNLRSLVQPFAKQLAEMTAFSSADVVHYHLIHNGIFSFLDFPELTRSKPSVLTVHDPWLLTGHCIHPTTCTRWKTGCGNCPDLKRDFAMQEDNTAMMWRIRREIFKDVRLDFVAASRWMKRMIEESPITRGCGPVHLIPFGLDTSVFHPVDADARAELRQRMKITPDEFVLMFRQDPSMYKGMDAILRAVVRLSDLKHITLLTVGATGTMKELKGKACRIIEIPWQNDSEKMADYYRATDMFLMPSVAESFGLMALEAMGCGNPLVVCEGTATAEIAHAPHVALSIRPGDDAALADCIERMRRHPEERRDRSAAGVKLVAAEYEFEDYVRRHMELYEEILSRHAVEAKS